jgi:hypothetical protein
MAVAYVVRTAMTLRPADMLKWSADSGVQDIDLYPVLQAAYSPGVAAAIIPTYALTAIQTTAGQPGSCVTSHRDNHRLKSAIDVTAKDAGGRGFINRTETAPRRVVNHSYASAIPASLRSRPIGIKSAGPRRNILENVQADQVFVARRRGS